MKNKKLILLYCFFLFTFCFIVMTSCSTPTESSEGSLAGTVTLEGESDHSGITIALYNLAYLDTTIVRINTQYPQIGVHINQHTEFDHRLQSPVKYVETQADGSFELTKISTGRYNLVAVKDGWGFKYLYEIEIGKGDNEINQQITLYEEITYDYQIPTTTFLTDHHYIIDNPHNEVVLYNTSLIIQPGAVVRITPNTDFVIAGTLTAQGEENNMFWITSNDGFSQEIILNTNIRDEILIYNSMKIITSASISDDLIKWGKFDYGNYGLKSYVSCEVRNCKFFQLIYASNFNEIDQLTVTHCDYRNKNNENDSSIFVEGNSDTEIFNNIFKNGNMSISVKSAGVTSIENNYFYGSNRGIDISYNTTPHIFNNFINSIEGIFIGKYSLDVLIEDNVINSNFCIRMGKNYSYGIVDIHNNNLYFNDFAIYQHYGMTLDVNAQENCFIFDDQILTNSSEINEYIWDLYDNDDNQFYSYVIFEPFKQVLIHDIGIN